MDQLAVFDLDGTLYDGRVWQAVAANAFRHLVKPHYALLYLVKNLGLVGLYKVGLVEREIVWDRFGREIGVMLRGLTPTGGRAVLGQIYAERIVPHLDIALLPRWKEFSRSGTRCVIVSGAPQPLLDVIGAALGADGSLGTQLEVRHGRYTGGIVGQMCQGPEKARRLLAYAEQQGWDVDWSASYSFADSYSDVPILQLTGHPHVIRADPGLRSHAAAAGWPMIGE